jgi:hypothetical protein
MDRKWRVPKPGRGGGSYKNTSEEIQVNELGHHGTYPHCRNGIPVVPPVPSCHVMSTGSVTIILSWSDIREYTTYWLSHLLSCPCPQYIVRTTSLAVCCLRFQNYVPCSAVRIRVCPLTLRLHPARSTVRVRTPTYWPPGPKRVE